MRKMFVRIRRGDDPSPTDGRTEDFVIPLGFATVLLGNH